MTSLNHKDEILELTPDFEQLQEFGLRLEELKEVVDEPRINVVQLKDDVVLHYYSWNDGAGNAIGLYVDEDSEDAMLVFYANDSIMNFYSNEVIVLPLGALPQFEAQAHMYDFLPEKFLQTVCNREEDYEFLNIESALPEDNGVKVALATGVIYISAMSKKLSEGTEYFMRELESDGGMLGLLKTVSQ